MKQSGKGQNTWQQALTGWAGEAPQYPVFWESSHGKAEWRHPLNFKVCSALESRSASPSTCRFLRAFHWQSCMQPKWEGRGGRQAGRQAAKSSSRCSQPEGNFHLSPSRECQLLLASRGRKSLNFRIPQEQARSKRSLGGSSSNPDKSRSHTPALPPSLMASQLQQSSTLPQRAAAGSASESTPSPKFQGAEWDTGWARAQHSLPLSCLHVKPGSAEVSPLMKLGKITMKNEIWELATGPINKLLCE